MNKFILTIFNKRIYVSIAIILVGIIIYKLIEKTINRILEKDKKRKRLDQKGKTIFKLFSNIAKYVILTIIIVLILQVYGVNVSSLIAGLGLLSVIAGLAIQDPLKDIVSGINMITDDYFSLGDMIEIDGIEGKVIQLGMRTTKIKTIKDDSIYEFANRNISKAIKMSNQLYIDVPLSYEDNVFKLEQILNSACEKIAKLENVTDAKYIGINEFAESAIIYKIKILCNPEFKLKTKRDANRIIKIELDENNIEIPYPQITIHTK